MAVNKRRLIPLHILLAVLMFVGVVLILNRPTIEDSVPMATVSSVNGLRTDNADAVEIALDHSRTGDTVTVTVHGQEEHPFDVTVSNQYSPLYVTMVSLSGIIYFIIAVFVFDRRPNDRAAQVFYGLCMSVGLLITSSPGGIEWGGIELLRFYRVVFLFVYTLMPVVFIHFTVVFPYRDWGINKTISTSLYYVGIAIATVASVIAIIGTYQIGQGADPRWGSWYSLAFNTIRLWMAGLTVIGIIRIAYMYVKAKSSEAKQKLLWVLLGVSISALAFVFLWIIPVVVLGRTIVPEEVVMALSIIAPVTFAIAVVRYQAFDISVILSVGLVHGVVVIIAVSIYVAVLSFALDAFDYDDSLLYFLVGIVLLDMILFSRVTGLVRRAVDKTLFRVQYDFRNRLSLALEKIRTALTTQELAEALSTTIHEALGPKAVQVVLKDHVTGDMHTHQDEQIETAAFHKTLSMKSGEKLGFVAVGQKMSGLAFTDEDQDLLENCCAQAEAQLERLILSHTIALEQAELERLEDLNRLRSLFVSGVTHDLKTPLTSIRMFAELLGSLQPDDKGRNYADIIEGESDRLARLIDQVLDYSRIERGVMEYPTSRTELNKLVEECMQVMQYQFKMAGFEVSVSYDGQDLPIEVSPDHFKNSVINLLSNALKYSGEGRAIRVETGHIDGHAYVRVKDDGIGIPQDMVNEIMQPFTRVRSDRTSSIAGTGLGLAMVHHFMQAHDGRVQVESMIDQGSTFTLLLPLSAQA